MKGGLWVDRRGQIEPGTPGVHALVIGSSDYPFIGSPHVTTSLNMSLAPLRTPATGAFRFAKWLRDRYGPSGAELATISLLLSASEDELQDPEVHDAAARSSLSTKSEVDAALARWKEACRGERNGVAILYVSGHGVAFSKTNVNVLLSDCGVARDALDYSLDVERVYDGMRGRDLPRVQLYFVDSCRVEPRNFEAMRYAHRGLGLDPESDGPDTRAAPIFFGSAPNGEAFGVVDGAIGTIFSHALLRCLEGEGAEGFVDERGVWSVTVHSLSRALDVLVPRLGDELGVDQEFFGEKVRGATIHAFDRPPDLPMDIEFDPRAAHGAAVANMWSWDRVTKVLRDQTFPSPRTTWSLPAGTYSLDVSIRPPQPPLASRSGIALYHRPRLDRAVETIALTDTGAA